MIIGNHEFPFYSDNTVIIVTFYIDPEIDFYGSCRTNRGVFFVFFNEGKRFEFCTIFWETIYPLSIY